MLKNLPFFEEWLDKKILINFNNETWNNSILKLHDIKNIGDFRSNFYRRLAFDEILASFLISSEIRKKIKKKKKKYKNFSEILFTKIIDKLNFNLTNDHLNALEYINNDIRSNTKMFR